MLPQCLFSFLILLLIIRIFILKVLFIGDASQRLLIRLSLMEVEYEKRSLYRELLRQSQGFRNRRSLQKSAKSKRERIIVQEEEKRFSLKFVK